APRNRDAEAGRGLLEILVELREHAFERLLGIDEVTLALGDAESCRDELVVKRRHDDLDAVVLDDRHALEQVLLRRQALCGGTLRRAAQLVAELVDPACGQPGYGAAGKELPPSQAHPARATGARAPARASSGPGTSRPEARCTAARRAGSACTATRCGARR